MKLFRTHRTVREGDGKICRIPSGPQASAILSLVLLASLLWGACPAQGAPVPVRYTEGMVRGFLVLNETKGGRIASGDFSQLHKGSDIKVRMVLKFKDGSLHEETAVFSQKRNFLLTSYHLIQKGPSFKDDMDASFDRGTGGYQVKSKNHKDKEEKVLNGKLDLPLDVYNGIVPTVAKNLKGAKETIHMVAFTPTPRVIEVEMIPSGEEQFLIGDLKKSAVHYVLKPHLGILTIPAMVTGHSPPDNHVWILNSGVPAFVKFEGPLATDGPIWRIELASPVWSK